MERMFNYMYYIEKYDGTKTYMYPNSAIATPEVVTKDFPAWQLFPHVIRTDGQTIYSFMSLASMRSQYDIDESLDDDAAIAAINEKMNEPKPEVEREPTAEEITATSLASIAASMEYQNLLTLDDVEEV